MPFWAARDVPLGAVMARRSVLRAAPRASLVPAVRTKPAAGPGACRSRCPERQDRGASHVAIWRSSTGRRRSERAELGGVSTHPRLRQGRQFTPGHRAVIDERQSLTGRRGRPWPESSDIEKVLSPATNGSLGAQRDRHGVADHRFGQQASYGRPNAYADLAVAQAVVDEGDERAVRPRSGKPGACTTNRSGPDHEQARCPARREPSITGRTVSGVDDAHEWRLVRGHAAHEVGPAGGDPERDRAAVGVAGEVHRPRSRRSTISMRSFSWTRTRAVPVGGGKPCPPPDQRRSDDSKQKSTTFTPPCR